MLKAQEQVNWGTVVSTGPGKIMEDGKIRPMFVKIGDMVLLPEYGGTSIKLGAEKEELFIYRDDDVLGILEEKLSWSLTLTFKYEYNISSIIKLFVHKI